MQSKLTENGVGSFVYYRVSVDKLPVCAGLDFGPLPNSAGCTTQSLSLPIWPKIAAGTQREVVDVVRGAVG